METVVRLQGIFFMSLKFLIQKFLYIKKFFPSLKGPRKGASFFVPQKQGPQWKQKPISRALLNIFFGAPSKETPSAGSLHKDQSSY